MIIDLNKYRKEEYTSEEEVWEMIMHLPPNEILIISNDGKELRVAKMKVKKYQIDIKDLQ